MPAFGVSGGSRRAFLRIVAAGGASALVAGCASNSIPRAGPGYKSIDDSAADLGGFTLIDMDASRVGYFQVRKEGDASGTAGTGTASRVALAPGDMIKVTIAESKDGGLFAPLASGGTKFENVRVDHRGTISLPYAGRVTVSGLELQQVEGRIRGRISNVAFEPQVYVELVADRGSSILVSGAVKEPGRFSTIEGPMTLIDAIARAGGSTREPHQVDVVLRRGRGVSRIALEDVYNGHNRSLQRGDEVVLEADLKVFNALGAVTKKGQVEFTKSNPTLLDALSQVGGLDNEVSHNKGVFVFRLQEPHAWQDEQGMWHTDQVIFRFDLSKPEMMFVAGAFGVRNEDTIYVTNAPTEEWERAIRPLAISLSTVAGTVGITRNVSKI